MRILGIVCSPRLDGNTEILVKEALGAAREAGCETELILVAGKSIAPCDACNSCVKTGVCRIEDDMQEVYRELGKADGIIFGTPSYWQNVSAQAKAIMDRTYALGFNRKLEGKVAGVIVAARRVGVGGITSAMYNFFIGHRMVIAGGSAGYGIKKGEVRESPGMRPDSKAIDEARSLGQSIVRLATQLERGKG